MRKTLTNEKGIALVTSLMLTLISLGMIMALLYLVTQATRISAAVKRYHNVTEAAYGGGELVAQEIIGAAWKNYSSAGGMTNALSSTYGTIGLAVTASNPCLAQKLSSPSLAWSACTPAQKSGDLASVKQAPDLSFLLKGTSAGTNYKVFAKIVDTSAGNTDTSSGSMLSAADSGGLVAGAGSAYDRTTGGGVQMQHIPYVYRLEVQGEKEVGPTEKSNVSVLYAY